MRVKELINELKKCNPNRDVIFWNGDDNIDIDYCNEDECNDKDVILGMNDDYKPYTNIDNIVNDMLATGGKK